MKKYCLLFILTLVLAACGTDSHHFKIDGHFLNLNQGEFYVYSPDGNIDGIDTIKVTGGRFTYETPCEEPCILVIVFPNFSMQPVFAQPGKSVDIKADASHLKKMTVKGTDENKLMNSFREQIESASPVEAQKYAEQFVEDHPESLVSVYLVSTYFIQSQRPDYRKAEKLLNKIIASQPENKYASHILQQVKQLHNASESLPKFQALCTDNKTISTKDITSAQISVITTWASWSYDSMEQQRQLKSLYDSYMGRLKVLSICVEASQKECKKTLERENIKWPVVCDGKMMEGSLLKKLGLFSVPGNIVLKNGRIIARNLTNQELKEKLEALK